MSAVNKASRLYSRQCLPTRTRRGPVGGGCWLFHTLPFSRDPVETLHLVSPEWFGARSGPWPFGLKCDSSV